MKKLSYLALGAAGLLLASCSQDDMPGISKGDGNYNLRVKLPVDLATRALSDGLKADNLHIAVYDADNDDALVFEALEYFNGQLETYVSLDLSQGKTYDIAFFAVSNDGEEVYNFNAEKHLFTVDYDNYGSAENLADAYDCFYQLDNTGVIGSTATEKTVTLYRPVAQINWGANDLNEKAVESENAYGTNGKYIVTTLTATNAYTEFDFFTKDVSGAPGVVTLKALASPAAGLLTDPAGESASWQFPVEPENYKYVAMQYMLAPQQAGVSDLTLNINNGGNPNKELAPVSANDVVVATAPVQANYRTNIYGTLLTDNMNFNVRKDPRWGEPDYNVNLNAWDGTSYSIPRLSNNTYMVGTAEEFYGLWKLGQTGNWTNLDGVTGESAISRQFVGKTIVLTADIDLGGHEFPRFGYSTFESNTDAFSKTSNAFAGIFDGQGYTISNFSIESMDDETNTTFGLFGIVNAGATVKNVNFANVNIQSSDENYCTGIIGYTYNSFIENVNVLSGTVKGKNNVGGVVGMCLTTGPSYYIKECSNAASVSGNFGVGGIVGFGSGYAISQCKNTGAVTGTNNSIGGIIGEQRWYGNITGCENTGTISGPNGTDNVGYAVGGIVGWIRNIDQFKPNGGQNLGHGFAPVQVLDNTNSGSVYGGFGVAGIVGTWYYGGVCTGNVNNAPVISASTANASGAAAGIVGATNLAGLAPSGNNPTVLTVSGNTSTTTDITGGTVYSIVNLGNPNVSGSGNTPENERIQ